MRGLRLNAVDSYLVGSFELPDRSLGLAFRNLGLPFCSFGSAFRSFRLAFRSFRLAFRSFGSAFRSFGLAFRSFGLPFRSFGLPSCSFGYRRKKTSIRLFLISSVQTARRNDSAKATTVKEKKAAAEAVVGDQILPARHRIAATAHWRQYIGMY